MEKRERRLVAHKVELREADGKPPVIHGTALVYNSISENLGCPGWFDWYEMVEPGAFADTVRNIRAKLEDCVALFNHDASLILGRSSAGTVEVTEDEKGVHYDITPPGTQYAKDLIENIRLGNITGSSFAMRVLTEDERMIDGKLVRCIKKGQLFDVSPVTYPAYPATNGLVSTRSNERTLEEYKAMYDRAQAKYQSAEFRARHLRLLELQ